MYQISNRLMNTSLTNPLSESFNVKNHFCRIISPIKIKMKFETFKDELEKFLKFKNSPIK